MLQKLILSQITKSLLPTIITKMKGASLWLIVLVAGIALGLEAAFGLTDESFLADVAESALAIACNK
jgi:hypothetical protein